MAETSGFNYSEPFDCQKVAVAANERCLHRQGGGRNPEVVLIQRKSSALLRTFHSRVPVTSAARGMGSHGIAANSFVAFSSSSDRRRPGASFSRPNRISPRVMVQTTTRSSGAIAENQAATRASLRMFSHESAYRIRVEKIDHEELFERGCSKEVACPNREPAGLDGCIKLVDIRWTRVGRFPHCAQDRRRGSGAGCGTGVDERDQPLQCQLFDAFALRGLDSLKAPYEVVRYFDGQARHLHVLPVILCRIGQSRGIVIEMGRVWSRRGGVAQREQRILPGTGLPGSDRIFSRVAGGDWNSFKSSVFGSVIEQLEALEKQIDR